MRVSMKYNAVPTACEAFSYGQVEDYTINIVSTAKGTEDAMASKPEFKLFPNPVKDALLNVSDVNENATYRLVNTLGQEVGKGKITNGTVTVSNLNAGAYLLEVTSDGQTSVKRFIKQ